MWFLHMFHDRFAKATLILLCKSNQYKLENMKNEPNNTHIPYHSRLKEEATFNMIFSVTNSDCLSHY